MVAKCSMPWSDSVVVRLSSLVLEAMRLVLGVKFSSFCTAIMIRSEHGRTQAKTGGGQNLLRAIDIQDMRSPGATVSPHPWQWR